MSSNEIQKGIGLTLSTHDLYPPIRGSEAWVEITTRLRSYHMVDFSFTVNGQEGPFEGMTIAGWQHFGRLTITRDFIASYSGAWPVDVKIIARTDSLEEIATLTLYDTGNIVAVRAEITVSPARLQIPSEGVAYAVVGSQFYDANDIKLPPGEIGWSIDLVKPVGGVELKKSEIIVSPAPHANLVEVVVTGPSGVTGFATLTLYK